jgi:predicted porin
MSKLTPAAIGACLAAGASLAAAQSSVTAGGTMDLAARHVKNGRLGSISSEVSGSNATSKLIVRGVEDLGGGLSAGFYLDSTILGDSGGANTPFWDRRSTVSLAHARVGELRLGRDWVPTHLLWTAIDPFTTLGIASANTFRTPFTSRAMGQAFGTTAEAAALNPTLRVNNVIEYFLPAGLGGVYGALAVSAGEGGTAAAGATRGEGGRIGWANPRINVAYAQFITRNANANASFSDRAWGASYDFGIVRASVGQRRWSYGSDRTTNTLVGLLAPLGAGTLKLSYVSADQHGASAALSANDASLVGAGYVYNLSKRTAPYLHVARVSNKAGAAFTIPGGPPTSGATAASNYFGGQRSNGIELGVRHDF